MKAIRRTAGAAARRVASLRMSRALSGTQTQHIEAALDSAQQTRGGIRGAQGGLRSYVIGLDVPEEVAWGMCAGWVQTLQHRC